MLLKKIFPSYNLAGFTLVETLLYLALFSFFLLVVTEIFLSTLEAQTRANTNSIIEQDGQFIINRFAYDLKRANTVLIPANPGDNSNLLQLEINGEVFVYQLNNNQLELTNNLGTQQLNQSQTEITNLNFSRLGNFDGKNMIVIDFRVDSQSNRQFEDFQTAIGTR